MMRNVNRNCVRVLRTWSTVVQYSVIDSRNKEALFVQKMTVTIRSRYVAHVLLVDIVHIEFPPTVVLRVLT